MVLGDKDTVLSRITASNPVLGFGVIVFGNGQEIQVGRVARVAVGVSRSSGTVTIRGVAVEIAEVNVETRGREAGLCEPSAEND